jgi:hypothetical protein
MFTGFASADFVAAGCAGSTVIGFVVEHPWSPRSITAAATATALVLAPTRFVFIMTL